MKDTDKNTGLDKDDNDKGRPKVEKPPEKEDSSDIEQKPAEEKSPDNDDNKLRYSSPQIFKISKDSITAYKDAFDDFDRRIKTVELHAKTSYKFLAYMALILAGLSFFFAVLLFNRTMTMNSRLNSSLDAVMKLESRNKKTIRDFEERLLRTEIDYNRYIKAHLNEYLDEITIKLTALRSILDTQKQEELEMIIDRIQNIKNGERER